MLLEEGGTTVLLDYIIFWSASHCLSSISEPVLSKGWLTYINSFWICRIWIHAKRDPLFSATEVFQDSHGRLVYVLCIGFIILQFLLSFWKQNRFFFFEMVLCKRISLVVKGVYLFLKGKKIMSWIWVYAKIQWAIQISVLGYRFLVLSRGFYW